MFRINGKLKITTRLAAAALLVFAVLSAGCQNPANSDTKTKTITYTAAADGAATSTGIIFTFSEAVSGLTADNITITGGTGAADKGALSGEGTNWTLGITNVAPGTVKVKISKDGIDDAEKTVTLYKEIPPKASGLYIGNSATPEQTPAPAADGKLLGSAFEWLGQYAQDNTTYTIVLGVNETAAPGSMNSVVNNKTGVTLVLEGTGAERIVQLESSGSFTITSGTTLVLEKNITLKGMSNNNAPLIDIEDGGALEMRAGSKITGNTNTSSDGGGVFVGDNGKFTMKGGEISGNKVSANVGRNGGGVLVAGDGEFTMEGGKISGNEVAISATGDQSGAGGGVFVDGKFIMKSGEISGNKVSSENDGNGGGVYVTGKGEFTLQNGEVSGNIISVENYGAGGGVFVEGNGKFTMKSGEVSGNKIDSNNDGKGGGVFVSTYYGDDPAANGGKFTMEGGVISDNEVSAVKWGSGGGVLVNGDDNQQKNGEFVMSGGKISGNKVSSTEEDAMGGGVKVETNGSFTMTNGTISGNEVSAVKGGNGGGALVEGTFTLQGGKISDNKISTAQWGNGGGVAVGEKGTFTMQGGEILGNIASATDWAGGGGVNVGGSDTLENGGTFIMTNGKISGNKISSENGGDGGGVFVSAGGENSQGQGSGTFTMQGGEISGNIVSVPVDKWASGGGVSVGFNADSNSRGIFKKQPADGTNTSGIIYGYDSANPARTTNNKVVINGVVQTNNGSAVFVSVDEDSNVMKCENDVDASHALDSTADTGGGWGE